MPEAFQGTHEQVARTRQRIIWISRSTIGDLTQVVISIDGRRYEYDLLSLAADNAEYLFKHISAGKGLAYIKRHQRGWRGL